MQPAQHQLVQPESPFAKHKGELSLGESSVECYVLDDKTRVISLRATVKAIAGVETSKLSDYIGIIPLKEFIDKDSVMGGTIEFTVPGNPQKGVGIKAEVFLEICQAFVSAASFDRLVTEKQKENARRCAVLLSSCAKIGLIALIDEATGYQRERQEDELQVKLRAFIAEELRDWEKTFPDELWEEFGRLTQWRGSIHSRPKWWGKLVLELIYDALDPDIAQHLKEHKPPPKHGNNYHQWMTEDVGLKTLIGHIHQVIGIAKTCTTMSELRDKIAHFYNKEPYQLGFNFEEQT